MSLATALLAIYAAGVVIGLVGVDGSVATRVGLALAWPLGLAAFLVTVTLLLAVAAIVFPVFGAVLAAAIVVGWLVIS